MSFPSNFSEIRRELPPSVEILGAAKKQSVDSIQQAILAGLKIVGENYVQEAKEKFPHIQEALTKYHCQFHFIGPLQTNKVKDAVKMFDVIQSVDREKLLLTLEKECSKLNKILPILLQVNIGREDQKSGCLPKEVEGLLKLAGDLRHIEVQGLMTIEPITQNPEDARPYFGEMRELFLQLQKKYPNLRILSMGMSNTYRIAAEEGATMVRVGQALFGERSK